MRLCRFAPARRTVQSRREAFFPYHTTLRRVRGSHVDEAARSSEARRCAFGHARPRTQESSNSLIHKGFSPPCVQFAHSPNRFSACDDAETTHTPPTRNPQSVHRVVHADSTGCPHLIHMRCPSLTRANRRPAETHRAWVQLGSQLGITMGTTGPDCGQLGHGPKPSTGGPSCPRIHHQGSPHPRARSDLRERALSTQPTAPITVTALRSFLEENRTKTGDGRSWGQPANAVVLSTNSRGGRGDGDPGDGLTWMSAPAPNPEPTPVRDPGQHGGDPVARYSWAGNPSTLHEPRGSAVERMRA